MEMHKCLHCDRQLPETAFCCVYCRSKYRREGTCWYCGKRPVKEKSEYCEICQVLPKPWHKFTKRDAPDPVRSLYSRGAENAGRKLLSPARSGYLD